MPKWQDKVRPCSPFLNKSHYAGETLLPRFKEIAAFYTAPPEAALLPSKAVSTFHSSDQLQWVQGSERAQEEFGKSFHVVW